MQDLSFAELYTIRLYKLIAIPQSPLDAATKRLINFAILSSLGALREQVGNTQAKIILGYAKTRSERLYAAFRWVPASAGAS